jgi:ABC-type lipopolysaccharide export system ATPase subunit
LDFDSLASDFPEFRGKSNSLVKELSGGERRLVEVYIIIRAKARFAMLDEPFSHLMPIQIEKIKDLLLRENKFKGFLVTDHMFRNVVGISDYLYILKEGKLHFAKEPMDIERLGYANYNYDQN